MDTEVPRAGKLVGPVAEAGQVEAGHVLVLVEEVVLLARVDRHLAEGSHVAALVVTDHVRPVGWHGRLNASDP